MTSENKENRKGFGVPANTPAEAKAKADAVRAQRKVENPPVTGQGNAPVIHIVCMEKAWFAQFPRDRFSWVETAFTHRADYSYVVRELERLNPNHTVVMHDDVQEFINNMGLGVRY